MAPRAEKPTASPPAADRDETPRRVRFVGPTPRVLMDRGQLVSAGDVVADPTHQLVGPDWAPADPPADPPVDTASVAVAPEEH